MTSTSPVQKRSAGRRPKCGKNSIDTRTQILAAARCVFARRGLDGASVRDVAEAAKVNNAMIYYHFKDKLELYRSVLSDSFTAFDRIWEDEIFKTEASVRAKIRKYVEELIRFQHANEDFRRILSIEFASCGRNFKWVAENLFKNSYERLAAILKEGMKSGELQKTDPSLAIATLVGMIVQSFIVSPMAEYVSGRKLNLEVEQFTAFVTGMFFDGLSRQSEGGRTRRRIAQA